MTRIERSNQGIKLYEFQHHTLITDSTHVLDQAEMGLENNGMKAEKNCKYCCGLSPLRPGCCLASLVGPRQMSCQADVRFNAGLYFVCTIPI